MASALPLANGSIRPLTRAGSPPMATIDRGGGVGAMAKAREGAGSVCARSACGIVCAHGVICGARGGKPAELPPRLQSLVSASPRPSGGARRPVSQSRIELSAMPRSRASGLFHWGPCRAWPTSSRRRDMSLMEDNSKSSEGMAAPAFARSASPPWGNSQVPALTKGGARPIGLTLSFSIAHGSSLARPGDCVNKRSKPLRY